MEKVSSVHHEDLSIEQPKVSSKVDPTEEFSLQEQRKIIHRVDRRLVTVLGCLYCIALLDRTNFGNANIAGMAKDLDLIGDRYNILNLVFFPIYIFVQLPFVVIVRRIGPRLCVSILVTLWGIVMIGMGFVKTWGTMVPLRILLGVFEAGFFPASLFLLSMWYVRYDMQKRYAYFYAVAAMAGGFGGILAYGFSRMSGLAGLRGWRWIFIMEGILTCLLGIASYFFLVDFPEQAYGTRGFLSDREIDFVKAHINNDRQDAELEPFSLLKYLKAGLDLKVWGFAFIYFCLTTTVYSVAFSLPIILLKGFGVSMAAAQCLNAPPYAFAAMLMIFCGWLGDKYKIRAPILLFNACLTIMGLALIGWTKNTGVRYFGVFLTTGGANASVPAAMTYQANNIRGQWKRGFASATFVAAGALGGIAGSLVFRTRDSPTFHPGLYACIAANLLLIVVTFLLSIKFYLANKRAEAGGKIVCGLEGFRYTL